MANLVRGLAAGAREFTRTYKDYFGKRSWFELVAAEAPHYGYTVERSNYGGYALFQGEIDKVVIGFDGGPTFRVYSRPFVQRYLEEMRLKWKGKKRK